MAPRKIVLLDAVSTVIQTQPSVTEVYRQHGQRFGSALNEAEVKRRFKAARRKLFAVDTPAKEQVEGALVSSDGVERALWQEFIAFVFDDVKDSAGLFETLWDFFADPGNWRVYSDVSDCLARLKRQGHYVAIASNFDSRLIPIVDCFDELSGLDDVFCSANLGYRKPDPAFYRQVRRHVSQNLATDIRDGDVVFAGDCIENDFHGPRRMGWNAFWLDRDGEQNGKQNGDQNSEPTGVIDCPNSCRIVSLDQLSAVLE